MARRVGRPTGTGIKDGKNLDEMADALTRDPSKSVNSVIMALDSKEDPENLRRRLHRKWKKQGALRLAEARHRHEERNDHAAANMIESLRIGLHPNQEMVKLAERLRKQMEPNAEMKAAMKRITEKMRPHNEKMAKVAKRYEEAMRPYNEKMAPVLKRYEEAMLAHNERMAPIAKRWEETTRALEVFQRTGSAAAVHLTRGMISTTTSSPLKLASTNPWSGIHPAGSTARACTCGANDD